MGKMYKLSRVGYVILACACLAHAAPNTSKEKSTAKESSATKPETVWSTAPSKTSLKRETLPVPKTKGKSSESLRTASQTLFGYNGQNNYQGQNYQGQNYNGQYNSGAGGFGGFNSFAPGYTGTRQFAGGNGYNQYNQQLGNAYNVLGQNQGYYQGQQNPYYSSGFFGSNGYNYPYATNAAYPFGSPQGGFGGFGGYNSAFNSPGYYPGAQYQGQVGNRNFGFVNQGFGNPAFRNPQGTQGFSSSGAIGGIPSSVQVGTGLEVGSRGFSSSGVGGAGGFPSASGNNYIVGNGIGQPAFIGGIMGASGSPGGFGFGSPFSGIYTPGGIPGGLYRHQSPYDYPALRGSPSPSPLTASRPRTSATRLESSGANRYYQSGTYAPNSRERIYRYTSNES